jgi:tetrahydromethanopterin S-methyltransferase subunit H
MKIKSICLSVICCLLIVGNLFASGVEPVKKKKRRGKKVAFKKGQIGAQVAAGFLLSPDYSKTDYALYGTVEKKDKSFPLVYISDQLRKR